jgi:hypothetical protein
MATAGLPDPKINFYGADVSDTQAYQDALAASVQALEQRYANPNWFNVAAGFFKPQLGGFAASLGSASQALGENVEKQRESQLPLAQMRAQLAASKITMGQGSAAAKAFADWKATGQPMNEATYAHITGLAPDSPSAVAAKAAYEGERTGQTLKTSQQQLLTQQLKLEAEVLAQRRAAGDISVEEYKRGLASINDRMKTERPAVVPTGPTDTSKSPRQADADKPPAPTSAGTTVGAPMVPREVVSEPLAAAGSAAAAAPPAAAAAPPAAPEKIIIDSPLGSKSEIPEDVRKTEAVKREEKANARLELLGASGGTTETYEPAARIVEDQTRLIKDNPAIAKRVMSLMAQGTFRSQIEAMLQAGIGVNFAGLSGNINIPVAVAKRAGLNDKDRAVYDALANNFAAIAVMKQRAGGLSPNSARNAEIGLYNDLTPSMSTTPAAALKALGHIKNDLDATNAQYKFARLVYDNKHPDIKVDSGVPNRLDAILGHQSFSDVYKPFAVKNQQLLDAYQAYLDKPANKKP